MLIDTHETHTSHSGVLLCLGKCHSVTVGCPGCWQLPGLQPLQPLEQHFGQPSEVMLQDKPLFQNLMPVRGYRYR